LSSTARSTSKSTAPMQAPTPPQLSKEYIYVGGKLIATEESTGPVPHIDSISSTSGDPGQHITPFTISGTNLATVNQIKTDNSLLSASLSSASATSVSGSLTIDPQCPTGSHQIWVVTSGGLRSDNNAAFTVNGPTGGPVITNISPAQAKPGDSFTLTITGT